MSEFEGTSTGAGSVIDLTTSSDTSPDSVIPTQTAPTEHVVTPENPVTPAAKPKTMEDSIRSKFRELTKPQTIRAPDGKFAKVGDLGGEALTQEPVAPVEDNSEVSPVEDIAAPVEEEKPAVVEPTEKVPTSWRKDVQAKWAAVDPEVRKEIVRREADFHKGLETYKGWADVGQKLHSEIQPYEAMIRAAGTTPQVLIKDMFNTMYQLKTGSPELKTAVAMNILKEYGIALPDLQVAAEKLEAGEPLVDPQVQSLQTQLAELKKTIEEQSQNTLRSEFAEVVSETQKFAQAPGHEHYELVREEMAALLESGVSTSLQEAYDKAIWAHPQVREQLLAKQRETERKLAVDKAAAAKKAASTNVQRKGTLPSAPVVGTMDDTIRQTLRKIQSRGG